MTASIRALAYITLTVLPIACGPLVVVEQANGGTASSTSTGATSGGTGGTADSGSSASSSGSGGLGGSGGSTASSASSSSSGMGGEGGAGGATTSGSASSTTSSSSSSTSSSGTSASSSSSSSASSTTSSSSTSTSSSSTSASSSSSSGAPCLDTQTDPLNCGACGHDCEGGACVGGKCQPVLLATTLQAGRLAQDATHVYWVESDETCNVMKVPKAGGASVILAPGMGIGCGPHSGIVVDASYVYVARSGASEIAKVPIGGGPMTQVVHTLLAEALAMNATHLYWVGLSAGTGHVWRMPIGGGAPELLYSSPNQGLILLALDDTHIYTSMMNVGTFLRLPLAGGPAEIVASGGPGSSTTLTVDGSSIYWTRGNGNNTVQVRRAPKDGSGPAELMATLLGGYPMPQQTMVDATSLYVTASTNVWIVPLNGDPPVSVAPGATHAASVIADEKRIYWGGWYGNIMKVVR